VVVAMVWPFVGLEKGRYDIRTNGGVIMAALTLRQRPPAIFFVVAGELVVTRSQELHT
jgi:hypothetical protein